MLEPHHLGAGFGWFDGSLPLAVGKWQLSVFVLLLSDVCGRHWCVGCLVIVSWGFCDVRHSVLAICNVLRADGFEALVVGLPDSVGSRGLR